MIEPYIDQHESPDWTSNLGQQSRYDLLLISSNHHRPTSIPQHHRLRQFAFSEGQDLERLKSERCTCAAQLHSWAAPDADVAAWELPGPSGAPLILKYIKHPHSVAQCCGNLLWKSPKPWFLRILRGSWILRWDSSAI
jgi:hypothetical protein